MTINKDTFYLQDVELCKQLEPIMKKKGIEADKKIVQYYYCPKCGYDIMPHQYEDLLERKHEECNCILCPECGAFISAWEPPCVSYQTWIKPSLEAALPEWCFGSRTVDGMLDALADCDNPAHGFILDNYVRIIDATINRGQHSLECLAQLIILLDEEGVE